MTVSFLTKTSTSASGYNKNIGVYKANLDIRLILTFFKNKTLLISQKKIKKKLLKLIKYKFRFKKNKIS